MGTAFWMAVLSSIVASALVSGFAAFFGARVSLNRYYQEKWWDRKADAYMALNKHFRAFTELGHKIRQNPLILDFQFDDVKRLAEQLEKASNDFYLDLFESHPFLTQEAADVAYSIRDRTYSFAVNIKDVSKHPDRLAKRQETFRKTEEAMQILSRRYDHFLNVMREDLEITKPDPFYRSWIPSYFRRSRN